MSPYLWRIVNFKLYCHVQNAKQRHKTMSESEGIGRMPLNLPYIFKTNLLFNLIFSIKNKKMEFISDFALEKNNKNIYRHT
jgi:hypothetical protein